MNDKRYEMILGAGVLLVAMIGFLARERVRVPEPIVLETAHEAVLPPHEHEAGDAVSDTGHHIELSSAELTVRQDIAATDVDFEIVNAPKTIVHHAALLALRCIDSSCRERMVREIVRHGQDTMYLSHTPLPDGYMTPIHAGEKLILQLTVHNPEPPLGTGETYHDVYARITIRQRSAEAAEYVPVHFLHLFVSDTCEKSDDEEARTVFTVPAHAPEYRFGGCHGTYDRSTFTFPAAGTIVHMGAHLHGWQGGKELIVYKNGKPFRTFRTAVSKDDPLRYDTEHSQDPVQVAAGDTFTVAAVYENPGAVPVRGAMGMFGVFVTDEQRSK